MDNELKEEVLNLCKRISGQREIVAACIYGSHIHGYADERSDVNVLLVLDSSRFLLKCYKRHLKEFTAMILTVDNKTFEKDIEEAWLGDLIVETIFTPYEPLINRDYLRRQEAKAKKRIVRELLDNLISEFPELSYEFHIKPEYFIFEAMLRKASLFTPLTFTFVNMMRGELRERNLRLMMKGYIDAFNELEEEKCITLSDGYIRITKEYIDAARARRFRITEIFKLLRRRILRQIFRVFPKMMRSFLRDQEIYADFSSQVKTIMDVPILELEDSKKYLFVPTPIGLVSFTDTITVIDFLKKTVPEGNVRVLDVEKMGGALNSVYLVTFRRGNQMEKIVIKMFKDWYGLKWFPLALWALGTKGFSVLGKSRLEKEYAINRFLSSQGIRVPMVLYVNPRERLIFEEFTEGTNMVEVIKEIIPDRKEAEFPLRIIRQVGRKIAEIHKLGVALGDCKPENIIITLDEEICFLDLEQASKDGDKAWDIAEFLYYAGHYLPLLSPPETAKDLTGNFIEGYLEAGGDIEKVTKAASTKYIKVFSFFTPPHIIFTISNTIRRCKEKYKDRIWSPHRVANSQC